MPSRSSAAQRAPLSPPASEGAIVAPGTTNPDALLVRGLGTPAPVLPPRHLVVTGLYRHVRNPMYVAVVAAIAGQGLLLGDLRVVGWGSIVWAGFHLFVVGYEEPALRRTFGEEYERFRAAVPRWIPRWRAWRGE